MGAIKLSKRKIRHLRVRKKSLVLLIIQGYLFLGVINLFMHKSLMMNLTRQLFLVAVKIKMFLLIRLKTSPDYHKKL